jgi:ribosomal protein S8
MLKKNSFLYPIYFSNFFNLLVKKQIIQLFNKTKKKHVINIFSFFAHLKNNLFKKTPLAIFYSTPYFNKILEILKNEFFIFNYFRIPLNLLPENFLTKKIEKKFLNNLVCIIFKPINLFGNLNILNNITIISSPSRTVFVTYKQLNKLVQNNTAGIFFLNTTEGLLSHKNALKKKIGGSLLCKIN